MQELAGLNRYAESKMLAVNAAAACGSEPEYFSAVEEALGAYGAAAAQVPHLLVLLGHPWSYLSIYS